MYSFFKNSYDEILEALKAWDSRKEQSIKAGGTNPVYDRYDPKFGFHDEPKNEVQ